MGKKKVKVVWWYEPYWSFVPRFRSELWRALPLVAWLRIIGLAAVITLVIAVCCHILHPNLNFNWFLYFVYGVCGIFSQLKLMMWIHLAIPPTVKIRGKDIIYAHGQSVRWYKQNEIKAVHLLRSGNDRTNLWIATSELCKRYGVSNRVNLSDMRHLLGNKLIVHDNQPAWNSLYARELPRERLRRAAIFARHCSTNARPNEPRAEGITMKASSRDRSVKVMALPCGMTAAAEPLRGALIAPFRIAKANASASSVVPSPRSFADRRLVAASPSASTVLAMLRPSTS